MKRCEVQVQPGQTCDHLIVATWDWGGPTLAMCKLHDTQMKRHIAECKSCRTQLTRIVEVAGDK